MSGPLPTRRTLLAILGGVQAAGAVGQTGEGAPAVGIMPGPADRLGEPFAARLQYLMEALARRDEAITRRDDLEAALLKGGVCRDLEQRLSAALAEEDAAWAAAKLAFATLLAMPATTVAEVSAKLAVIIAAGEPGPAESQTFPWPELRSVLADLDALEAP